MHGPLDEARAEMCSLQQILIESTKTAEYSFLNTFFLPQQQRFVQIKQQSILFNSVMSRIVMIKDVTRILKFKHLQQEHSQLQTEQQTWHSNTSNAEQLVEIIHHIERGTQMLL